MPLQEIGSVVSLFGILVTFRAFFHERGYRPSDIWPRLAKVAARARAAIRRRLGRARTVQLTPHSTGHAHLSLSATGLAWANVSDEDAPEDRFAKIERNLDNLRAYVMDAREADRERLAAVDKRLTSATEEISRGVRESTEAERAAALATARQEVNGLVIALFGAVLTLVGSLL